MSTETMTSSSVVVNFLEYNRCERPVKEQINSLGEKERKAVADLRKWWDDKEKRDAEYDDYMILRLLRASPGKEKFNIVTAKKVAEKWATWSKEINLKDVTIRDIRAQLESGLFIITGGHDKDGHATLYAKPSRFRNNVDKIDDVIKSLLYLLEVMAESERTSTYGLSFLVDLEGFCRSNISVSLARTVIAVLQGRYPCRLRKLSLCNAPDVFSLAWRMFRPFIGAELNEKITFVKGDSIAKEYPDPAHLPTSVGGQLDLAKQLQDFIQYRYKVEGLDYNASYPGQKV